MQANRRRIVVFGCAVLAVLHTAGGTEARAQTFAAVTRASPTSGGDSVGALILTDGQRLLTAPTFLNQSYVLSSLTRNPLTGDIFTLAGTVASIQVARVDLQTGTVTPIGPGLTAAVSSLAFDSHGQLYGYALCDTTYSNTLFSMDAASGSITGVLGNLDSARVPPCGSGLTAGGTIAIDPSTDVLYFVSVDASGQLFVDRMDSFLVPTLLYSQPYFILPVVPSAATFANGQLWVSTVLTQLGPGTGFESFDPSGSSGSLANGAFYWTLSFPNTAAVFGLLATTPACVPSPTTACLFNRFKIAVTYDATPANGSGPANVLLESAESVKFSFFDPANVELIVKILNACVAPYNKWWVSGGGLTNVGVSIAVTDTDTGKVKTYASAKGQLFQTFFDTAAFNCP